MFKTVLIKYKQWEYEQEWRLIPEKIIGPDGCAFSILKPKAIYLGTKINENNKKEIMRIAKKKI